MFEFLFLNKPLKLATKTTGNHHYELSPIVLYEHFPDQNVSLFDFYALVKTGTYFVLLAVINKVVRLLTRY